MPQHGKGNMRFQDQPLKRKRMQLDSTSSTSSSSRSALKKGARPTFQFKIGMEVGVALGDCFLQLQRLENSMDTLRNVSEDITVVMQCINEQMVPKSKGDAEPSPTEDVAVLNSNLVKWQRDASKRMKHVSATVSKLQSKLEVLDEYHSEAQQFALSQQQTDRSEVSAAMSTIE